MTGIERGVRAFVNEGFFKNAFGRIQICLTCMNKHIVVAATEQLNSLVNPDCLEIGLSKGSR